MNKVHHTEDHEDLYQMLGGQMWSLYDDRYHIKSAASDIFSQDTLRKYAPDKDHFMMHLVAMGDYETFGPNKNADAFRTEGLKKYAHTFVTDGCFFREHRNRSQEKEGIGIVKAAAYNPDMHRVELVVWGDREKAASEYADAKAGKPLSFSMSCRVPYDECNACGNKARTPREYCGHMKESRLQYIPELKKYAFVHNDKPTFFDISKVGKPADRIAHYLDYAFPDEDMRKAAATQMDVILGSEWAEHEGVCIPQEKIELTGSKYSMLEKLASEEAYINDPVGYANTTAKAAFVDNILPQVFDGELSEEALDSFRTLQPGTLMHHLSKRACILPFTSFVAYITNQSIKEATDNPTVKVAKTLLPNTFRNIKEAGCGADLGSIEQLFNSTGHNTQNLDRAMTGEVQRLMDKVANNYSITSESVKRRVLQNNIEKSANKKELVTTEIIPDNLSADFEKAEGLVNLYGLYKIAALVDMKDIHGIEIDEPQILISISQHRVF